MHLHEWDWWAFWWSGELLCPVFPHNTCRWLKFRLLYFQFYFVILKFLSETQKRFFSKHLTICLYLLYSILFLRGSVLCPLLERFKKIVHIPDDNIQLCFCVNDSQTLSNAQKWIHNVCGRHYYGLCHFLLLVKGLYKVNQGMEMEMVCKTDHCNLFFCFFRPYSSVYLFQTPEKTFPTLQKMRYIIQQILNPSVYLFLLIHFQNPSIVCGDYQSLSRFS